MYCVAYKCSNRPEKDKKKNEQRHYFCFPNPGTDKERCKQWLHNIGRDDITFSNFDFNKNKTVCSDHFHPSCLLQNRMAKLMPDHRPATKKVELKPGSIPNIFYHKVYDVINVDGEVVESARSSEKRAERQRKEV